MKNIFLVFGLTVFSTSFCVENSTPKPIEVLNLGSYTIQGVINNQGEFILCKYDKYEDACSYYYSNLNLQGAKIPLSEIITDRLIELGFEPIYTASDRKTHFQVYPADMDDEGNVFVLFEQNQRDVYANFVRGLGVWHKDKGFTPLQIPKIHSVNYVILNKTHLMVFGQDKVGANRLALFLTSDFKANVHQKASNTESSTNDSVLKSLLEKCLDPKVI